MHTGRIHARAQVPWCTLAAAQGARNVCCCGTARRGREVGTRTPGGIQAKAGTQRGRATGRFKNECEQNAQSAGGISVGTPPGQHECGQGRRSTVRGYLASCCYTHAVGGILQPHRGFALDVRETTCCWILKQTRQRSSAPCVQMIATSGSVDRAAAVAHAPPGKTGSSNAETSLTGVLVFRSDCRFGVGEWCCPIVQNK